MITCVLAGIFAVASVCAAAAIAISLRALRLVDWERQVAKGPTLSVANTVHMQLVSVRSKVEGLAAKIGSL